MLTVAAMAALALSGCVGGGGGSGGGPVVSGQGQTRGYGLGARGVKATIIQTAGGQGGLRIDEGEFSWSQTINHKLAAPTGWKALTRGNAATITHRFHAVTDVGVYGAINKDTDYLVYGHWAENFDKPTEKPAFQQFWWGKQPYTGSVPASTATATYTGGAAGIYKDSHSGKWGYFGSDISLSANFGDGEITATLSSFSIVSLFSPSFSFSSVTTAPAKISGGSFTHAKWGGRFFGPSGAAPTGAAGWFEGLVSQHSTSGNSSTATLYGSFAANK